MIVRLATANPGKVRELAALLRDVVELQGPPAGYTGPDEDGETFAANALLKARALSGLLGEPAIADDSGLVVDALDGRPGVHSARYAATDGARNARLLGELAGVVGPARSARFVCAMAVVFPGGTERVFEGRCEGRIADAEVGTGGFGYDPVFLSADLDRTFGEASAEEKARVSHRGRAVRELAAYLQSRA